MDEFFLPSLYAELGSFHILAFLNVFINVVSYSWPPIIPLDQMSILCYSRCPRL